MKIDNIRALAFDPLESGKLYLTAPVNRVRSEEYGAIQSEFQRCTLSFNMRVYNEGKPLRSRLIEGIACAPLLHRYQKPLWAR